MLSLLNTVQIFAWEKFAGFWLVRSNSTTRRLEDPISCSNGHLHLSLENVNAVAFIKEILEVLNWIR